MASRFVAQIILMGAGYVGRAFVQAYQQALVNSARNGGSAAAAGARGVRGRIGAQEASEILGVKSDAGLKDIYVKYDKLFSVNDPTKGGSLYLQAKIHNAKMELEKAAIGRGEIPRQQTDEAATKEDQKKCRNEYPTKSGFSL
eukprot:IDg9976t1